MRWDHEYELRTNDIYLYILDGYNKLNFFTVFMYLGIKNLSKLCVGISTPWCQLFHLCLLRMQLIGTLWGDAPLYYFSCHNYSLWKHISLFS